MRFLNIFCLCGFISTTKQDYDDIPLIQKINTKSSTIIYFEFRNTFSNWLNITKVAK
ncbi:MAG: hypothetical protein XD73_0618 [Anaerolinea thermophila]|uniref:Uncharacterized protein n=1 Tax=Anaerolinea thermophila TaxID=167964 RepID=A0A117LGV1_9CHLR|nr:MAG: hypothetical protein XD73_0618 [Anaerolinea thermophila]